MSANSSSRDQVPRLVLGLPVYNGENYIADAIEAILTQSWGDYKLIILDNASDDNTKRIAEQYAERDGRIEYHRNSVNIGAARNFNRVFQLAGQDCEYFKWVAHDDVIRRTYLEEVTKILDDDPSCVLCHSGVEFIDEYGKFLRSYDPETWRQDSDDLSARFGDMASLVHACFDVFGIFRRDVLASTPCIATYIGSDRNLLAEVALYGKIRRADGTLFLSRSHASRSIRMAPRHDRGGWFAQELSGQIAFPHWKHLREFLRSANSVPAKFSEKVKCYRELAIWMFRTRRHLVRDVLRGVYRVLRRTRSHVNCGLG